LFINYFVGHLNRRHTHTMSQNYEEEEKVVLLEEEVEVVLLEEEVEVVLLEHCQIKGHDSIIYKDKSNIVYGSSLEKLGRLDGNKIIYIIYRLK
jgi:hypothetical protein